MNQSLLSEAQRSVTATDTSVAVPIHLSGNRPGLTQPFTVGVPFPPGLLSSSTRWALSGQDGTLNEVQHHVQSCWPDGSLQWLQIHFSSRQLGGSQSALLQPLNAESAVRLASHRDVLRIQPAESSGPLSSVT
ncbi:MAG: hypothetical protein KDA45_14405, partial [Planctomycetales bacterium]|nr:hypothetical protein [Planctomycetales bacterium]